MIDITQHEGLTRFVIRKRGFARRAVGALEYDDLIQEGALALMRAAQSFDPAKGSWSTYAAHWLRQSISRSLQDKGSVVRVPVHLQEKRLKAGERILPIVRRLDLPLAADSDTTLGDMTADDDAPTPEEIAEAGERKALLKRIMWKAKLSPRERRVIELRAREVVLDDIGDELGISRERARQIESEALKKLRRAAGVPEHTQGVSLAEPSTRKPSPKKRKGPWMQRSA